MTGDEIGKLLGLMALADNRKPPEDDEGRRVMIEFWLRMVGDLTYADASEAVLAHYRESREWVMPSDIRERVKAVRAERLDQTPPPPPPPELLDDPDAYRQYLRESTKRIADGKPELRMIGGTSS